MAHIDPEPVEGLAAGLPNPPFAIRSKEQLIALLEAGVNSPYSVEATPEFWKQTEAELLKALRRP